MVVTTYGSSAKESPPMNEACPLQAWASARFCRGQTPSSREPPTAGRSEFSLSHSPLPAPTSCHQLQIGLELTFGLSALQCQAATLSTWLLQNAGPPKSCLTWSYQSLREAEQRPGQGSWRPKQGRDRDHRLQPAESPSRACLLWGLCLC